MNNIIYDITVIGGGIIGTSTAMQLSASGNFSVALLEAENKLAAHQTGNNSGVIHSGLYYKPGSLKALNCTNGRDLLYAFCSEHNIKHEKCGKVVIAVNKDQISALDDLEKRGKANGLEGLERLTPAGIKLHEPYAAGIDGLFVPQTGIVDYITVTEKYGELLRNSGGTILTGTKFLALSAEGKDLVLDTTAGKITCRVLVNCAGLHSDHIAKMCGVNPDVRIVPFRGEYYKLKPSKELLIKNLLYPVPDPEFPFLGVHFTRMIKGGVEAGPNAVLAFKREGYKKSDFSFNEMTELVLYKGFRIMARKYYKMGFGEFYRSFNKKAFVAALQKLVPEIQYDDFVPGGAGVRAQALDNDGKLIDDFKIIESPSMVHVLNAPSPAATASLSIGKKIAEIVQKKIVSL